jgi:hypothetical protein
MPLAENSLNGRIFRDVRGVIAMDEAGFRKRKLDYKERRRMPPRRRNFREV